MSGNNTENGEVGAWNPGIRSSLPAEYLPLATIFRPENVSTTLTSAKEIADFTGLPLEEVVCFRPQRLIVHELLVRVSADLFVSDGSRYEDLGVNFRRVVNAILEGYIEPGMAELTDAYAAVRGEIEQRAAAEWRLALERPAFVAKEKRGGGMFGWLRGAARQPKPQPGETFEQRQQRLPAEWQARADAASDGLTGALFAALARVANALVIKHGRLVGDSDWLTRLVADLACNRYGSEHLGQLIEPSIRRAAEVMGYRLLPAQAEPIVINVKGASAAGKSTMRPLQKLHVEKLGLNWQDFALISPDIWRKYLLDYQSLGDAFRYAGTLTGYEIPLVDAKLDRYIADKAAAGRLSHLLIDRFRFDSFTTGGAAQGSNLLTRFGQTVYLVFLVTPPPATVERAWQRGLQVGRYKSVDDLLDHNIEAFKGIPVLFFTWALNPDKTVYFEFLDNSVEHKSTPRTIAFGCNREMYLVDFQCMIDIVRYTRVNVDAATPQEVFPSSADLAAEANTAFLVDCARRIEQIHFVDRASCRIYASMAAGKLQWADQAIIAGQLKQTDCRAGFAAMLPGFLEALDSVPKVSAKPVPEAALQHVMGDLAAP